MMGFAPLNPSYVLLGITDDTIVAWIFREVRPFRIYDGPSEVHRSSIAQRVLRAGGVR